MKKNNTAGKILSGALTVLVALVPAKAALVLMGCPSTTNNNGTETPPPQPPVDLPREQTAQISLPSDHTGTVQGYMTDAEWDGIADRIENTIQARFDRSSSGVQNAFLTVFAREKGIIIIAEAEPTFEYWKTTGDGRTVYINLALNQDDFEEIIGSAVVAAFQNRNAVDGLDVTTTAEKSTTQSDEQVARLSAMEMRAIEQRVIGGARVSVKIFKTLHTG